MSENTEPQYEVALILRRTDGVRNVGNKLFVPLDAAPEVYQKALGEAFEGLTKLANEVQNQFFTIEDVRRETESFVSLVDKVPPPQLNNAAAALGRVFSNLDPKVGPDIRAALARQVEKALDLALKE
jgi:hypothetical protein